MEGTAKAIETPIGNLPTPDALDLDGLDLDREDLQTLLAIDREGWLSELPLIREYYAKFGDRMPQALLALVDELETKLQAD